MVFPGAVIEKGEGGWVLFDLFLDHYRTHEPGRVCLAVVVDATRRLDRPAAASSDLSRYSVATSVRALLRK